MSSRYGAITGRMEIARKLLVGSLLPLKEVAERAGYRDASNFGRAFRAFYGCSPRAYGRDERLSLELDHSSQTDTPSGPK